MKSGCEPALFLGKKELALSKVSETVSELVRPYVEEEGCRLWDVEYIKEAGTFYLRVFIDKDGGVTRDDCERVSRRLDPVLDEADPIPESYVFEVGSPGAERELKRPSDFEKFLGSDVEVRLYKSTDGKKSLIGKLLSYEDGDIRLLVGNEEMIIKKQDIAQVRLHVTF